MYVSFESDGAKLPVVCSVVNDLVSVVDCWGATNGVVRLWCYAKGHTVCATESVEAPIARAEKND